MGEVDTDINASASAQEFLDKNRDAKTRVKVLKVLGLTDADVLTKELSLWDKKKWLVLEDFWLGKISQERADEMIENIVAQEKLARVR